MITAEQVADLRDGDVVTLTCTTWPAGTTITGPVWGAAHHEDDEDRVPFVGPVRLATAWGPAMSLTVVSRAPRPLYVNHPRTEPCPSDVVRSADPGDDDDASTWSYLPLFRYEERPWVCSTSKGEVVRVGRHELPDRLRLLVDGETGQVVPS